MLEKLDFLTDKYEELNNQISDPEIIADQPRWKKLMMEHAHIEPIIEHYREYQKACSGVDENEELLQDKSLDPDLKELAEEELAENKAD